LKIRAKIENLQSLSYIDDVALYFFFFFKFYVLMQSKTMKHDAIYLNSSTEALCVC